MSSKNIVDLLKEEKYRKVLTESLTSVITESYLPAFIEVIDYVIDKKFHLFQIEEFENSFYYDDDSTLDLVLPSVRRVFAKVFIDPPSLFKGDTEKQRYQLFILYFNIDEFIEYLIDMMIKCKKSLEYFENIDRTSETLTLIVDNYIAGLVKMVRKSEDIEEDIKRVQKKINRENNISEILGND